MSTSKRKDKTFPISIRVTWKQKSAYIKTEYQVHKKQLTKTFELKDPFILRELNNRIARYEEIKVQKLGSRIELYTAKELVEYFVKQSSHKTGKYLISLALQEIMSVKYQSKAGNFMLFSLGLQ